MIRGEKKVIHDLNEFVRRSAASLDEIGYELKTSVVRYIYREHAIDTAAMIQSIDYTKSFVTDSGSTIFVGALSNTEVFYDGFVELPTRNRDGTMREGRYFYRQGIENANFKKVFDDVAHRSFVI